MTEENKIIGITERGDGSYEVEIQKPNGDIFTGGFLAMSVITKKIDPEAEEMADRVIKKSRQGGKFTSFPRWISVDDRLPPVHENVWCLNSNGRHFEGRICYGMHEPFFTIPRGDGNASNTHPAWINVTHWMPLPELPKENK